MNMHSSSDRHPLSWLIFLLSALTAIGLFFIPAFIIRPFRHQTPAALHLAMTLRQRAPWGTLAAAFVCLTFAVILWQTPNMWQTATRWRRIFVASVMVLVTASAVMARLNYFEWMFHPVDSPQFQSATETKLDKAEMILAVEFGGDARAYPISEMAYHHILNDVVDGVPIAVTY
jgi:Protein of unknown function (DUF3179)